MKLLYDPKSNTAYIALRDESCLLQSRSISDAVRVDIGADGRVHGILLLAAHRQLTQGGEFVLETLNQTSGEKQEIKLDW